MFRWKATAATVAIAALALTGCSGSSGDSADGGGTLTLGALTEPLTLDPAGSEWGNRSPFYQAVSMEARSRVRDLLERVGLPAAASNRLPREFSGGQRQRIAIACALALDPRLIVCDEPVSALDLSTQARVLDLFIEIQERTGVAYLFITHDLAVVRHISHRVAVMYHGEIVETGDADQVTARPEHPYTQRLFMAAPLPDPDKQEARRRERAQARSMDSEGEAA